jgi:hypothetical protein
MMLKLGSFPHACAGRGCEVCRWVDTRESRAAYYGLRPSQAPEYAPARLEWWPVTPEPR